MIIRYATVADVMAWAKTYGSPLPRMIYKSLIAQVVVSEAFTLREAEGGEPLVIAGCVNLEPDHPGEVFFFAPPGGLGRKLVTVHALARRWLKQAAEARPSGLVCWVRRDNRRGQRLALALGFEPTEFGGECQLWRFVHGPGFEDAQGPVRRRREQRRG